MKNLIKISFFAIMAFAFSQTSQSQNATYAAVDLTNDLSIEKVAPAHISNFSTVLSEVKNHLNENLHFPEEQLDFYNSDIIVSVSFKISKTGTLENIIFADKENKALGKQVVQQLESLSKVSPVVENGEVIEKYVILPVVYRRS